VYASILVQAYGATMEMDHAVLRAQAAGTAVVSVAMASAAMYTLPSTREAVVQTTTISLAVAGSEHYTTLNALLATQTPPLSQIYSAAITAAVQHLLMQA